MTEWRKAGESSRPMMARAAADVQPLAQVVGDIPDEHVITVAERRVSVDYPTIIQNNMNTDTVDLVLDGEWDGMSVVCYIGHPGDLSEFEWEGEPFTLPVYDTTGSIDVTVVGLSADGKTRLVIVEAKGVMNVIKSGEFEGSVPPEDQPDLLGQILAAKGDAEEAADAANSAASAANSAASKANSAASSANSAATSANSAAAKANSAAVDAQNAYDTLQPFMATIDSCANILHREVGPDSVVTADDSFPCKPVEMTVYGNTVQNLWVNPSGSGNGVTFTPNSDGSVSISGSPTGDNKRVDSEDIYVLIPNTQYTISIDRTLGTSSYVMLVGHDAEGNQVPSDAAVVTLTRNETFKTFTVPSGVVSCTCGMLVNSNGTASGTYRIMLNEGSTAEPWCPPGLNSVGDDGSVKIVTAGKNLLAPPLSNVTMNGVTLSSDTESQTFSVHGTNTGGSLVIFNFPLGNIVSAARAGRLKIVTNIPVAGALYFQVNDADLDGTNAAIIARVGNGASETLIDLPTTRRIDFIFLGVNNHGTVNLDGLRVAIVPEEYRGEEHPLYVDGSSLTVDLQGHTLNSLPDGTRDELHIDGGGNVVLEKRTHVLDFDGTEDWNLQSGSSRANLTINDITMMYSGSPSSETNSFSDKLPALPPVQTWVNNNGFSVEPHNFSAFRSGMTGIDDFKSWLQTNNMNAVVGLAEPQTIDLGTITPPTMAAPNVTAYVADDTPAEMALDYVRDINIVIDNLAKQVAGTAATVAINEATR